MGAVIEFTSRSADITIESLAPIGVWWRPALATQSDRRSSNRADLKLDLSHRAGVKIK
jgi:hypothetical protein